MKTKLLAGALAAVTALSPMASAAENIIFGTTSVPFHPINSKVLSPWAEEVNASSNGAVNLVLRHGPALATSVNSLDRVSDGVIQMSFTVTAFSPGRFPRSLIANVPFVPGTAENAARAFCQMYEEGLFAEEFSDYKPMFFIPFPQTTVHMNGGPLTSLDDLAGKKLMAANPNIANIVTAHGGTPLSIKLPEQYLSLQRGTADGTVMTFTAFPAHKLHEVTTHHLELPLGGAMAMVFMSTDGYNALSDEAKAALEPHMGCDVSAKYGAIVDQWEADSRAKVEASGDHTFHKLSDEEVAGLKAKFFDKMAAGFAKRVPNGKAIFDRWVEIRAELKAGG